MKLELWSKGHNHDLCVAAFNKEETLEGEIFMIVILRGPSFPALVGGVARDCAELSLCTDITTWARGICAECRVRGAGLEKRKLY